MKKSGMVLLFILLAVLLPLISFAEDTNAPEGPQKAEPVKEQATSVKEAPVVVKESPVIKESPVLKTSPVITKYDDNSVASRAVEKNVGLFSKTIRERFSLYLSRSGQYMGLMKNILKKKDVPEDIVILSLIESGFNPNAYSIARAAGPWQFIASTAKRYGLQITWWKDERRDPVKSTEAAADYLKDLYSMFGSWDLAMAAYNAGEGKILKAMRRSKADDYWDLLGTRHIRNETKEYVPRFIAASLIAANPQEFGFEEIDYHAPMSYDEVEITAPIDLAVAAECAGTDLDTIKRLNPELRRWCTPPDASAYTLRIPSGTKDLFLEKLAAVPEDERFTIERYTARKGDTLKKIARNTGVPEQVILSLNAMEKMMPIHPGSKIFLPPKGHFVMDAHDKGLLKKAAHHKGKKKAGLKQRKKKTKRYAKRSSANNTPLG